MYLLPSRFIQTLNSDKASKLDKAASRMASQTDVMLYSADESPLKLQLKKFDNLYEINNHKTIIALI